jgi:AcrR family transcriptional regulator
VPVQQAESISVWSEIQPETARRILFAAVDVFADVGYYAASTREIAQRAGLSPAGMYAFFSSKAQLLDTISTVGHDAALYSFVAALADDGTPSNRVACGVGALVQWHAANHKLARIVQQELRALPAPAMKRIRTVRGRFVDLLEAELQSGVETGEFEIDDVPAAANAILSLCIDITRWYTPRSRWSPSRLAELYADLSLRMIQSP